MASTSAFFTNSDSSNYEKKSDLPTSSVKTKDEDIDKVYEIARCTSWIVENEYKRVALQFPDEMMSDSVSVTVRLEKAVKGTANIFILGDTSYGSCCVDEVAAQHYHAEAIIHYGRSCLSQPSHLPVLFVYGWLPIDVDNCVDQFKSLFSDHSANVAILYDTVYMYAIDELVEKIKQLYTNVVISRLHQQHQQQPIDSNSSTVSPIQQTDCDQSSSTSTHKTVTVCGRTIKVPSDKSWTDYSVFYIGQESLTLTNIIYQSHPCVVFTYNPDNRLGRKEDINVNKMLMKRYFMIEKAKDASIVGILIGTLGVANYQQMLNRLKKVIKKAGKKSYVFLVGKINVAKLANFMEIDIFVLIACAENTLLDSSEFYKPVVTPYEMELACNRDREWTGEYPTEFNKLLEGGSHHVPMSDGIQQEETDVSLVTGKLRRLGTGPADVETGSSVVLRSAAMTVATQADTAGEFLNMRTWQGLEQKLGQTPVTKAVEGQKGIAMGYNTEPSQN